MRTMADSGGKAMVRRTVENTPVSEPDPQRPDDHPPGLLRDSIQQKEVMKVETDAGPAWESGAYTDVIYAGFVEEGTGLWGPSASKYRIEPKDPNGVLAFYASSFTPEGRPVVKGSYNHAEGALVFTKYVMHPGSPGQHMFAIGAAAVEGEFEALMEDGLREWVRRAEQ
jgi:hypothetical protein